MRMSYRKFFKRKRIIHSNLKKHNYTKKEYIEFLNELGPPDDDLKSNGGRIPDSNKEYGKWLYINDTIVFNVGFQEWEREQK